MSDVKIGIKIQPSIYVTVKGLNIVVPMDISLINDVVDVESETIIYYNDYVFNVFEKKEDIEKAMRDAAEYKQKGVDYINSLLENGQSD